MLDESLKHRGSGADEATMADPRQFEQRAGSSLSLILTDAFAGGPALALGVTPRYELGTEDGDRLDELVADRDVDGAAGVPAAETSYIALQIVLPAEEFGAGVLIVQPQRAARSGTKE